MSAATTAAFAPLKTPRTYNDLSAWASQAFELHAAAHGQPPSRGTGLSARGALAIDVPRTLAATPRGWSLATTVVERGTGSGFPRRPAPTGMGAA